MSDLPTPRHYAGIHAVHAVCASCDHIAPLDLDALVAAGHGDTPFFRLRLTCSECGKPGHRIIVSGNPYRSRP